MRLFPVSDDLSLWYCHCGLSSRTWFEHKSTSYSIDTITLSSHLHVLCVNLYILCSVSDTGKKELYAHLSLAQAHLLEFYHPVLLAAAVSVGVWTYHPLGQNPQVTTSFWQLFYTCKTLSSLFGLFSSWWLYFQWRYSLGYKSQLRRYRHMYPLTSQRAFTEGVLT